MKTATLIRQAAVFDGTRLNPAHDVMIDGAVIAAVGPESDVPAGATLVEGTGQTLLPGLIDSHTHTTSATQLRQALVFGVTTELDMGDNPETSRQVRAAARRRDDVAEPRSGGAASASTDPPSYPQRSWSEHE